MHIEYVGRDAIVQAERIAYTYQQANTTPREFAQQRTLNNNLNWNEKREFLGDFIIHAYGSNNDLPEIIREVVQNNYIAPGILKKKTQLLWGSGPKLYKEVFKDNKLVKEWADDDEIQAWLDSWDYENYLLKACVDFQHIEGVFSRYELAKGSRIGKHKIAKLVHVPAQKARLATPRDHEELEPTHVVVTDWSLRNISSVVAAKGYELFDFTDPFKNRNSILYSNMFSFCTDYYTVPDLYGSLEWLNRSTAIPLILKALSNNSINLKYHIVSPQAFWDKKEKEMQENCVSRGIEYKSSMLEDYKEEVLRQVGVTLASEENTGKFWHTTKTFTVMDMNLVEHGWEINVVDQKVKDFVEAQILISERADRAVSAGVGLHGALGNVNDGGKADSGSEQLYALKNYMATGVDIPELIVMKAINYAIKANFPGKKLKLGFYHMQPEKEQNVSPGNRMINNNPAS